MATAPPRTGCTAWHSTPPYPSGAKKTGDPNSYPCPTKWSSSCATNPTTPLLNELYQLIDLLPKADRALIYLYIDGNSEAEIAAILGISPSAVGVRIHRIKQKLKDLNTEQWKTY